MNRGCSHSTTGAPLAVANALSAWLFFLIASSWLDFSDQKVSSIGNDDRIAGLI